MRWWAWIYLAVFILFALSCVLQDAMKKAIGRLFLKLIPFTACVAGALAYHYAAPSTVAGVVVGTLLLAGLPIIIWDGLDDIRDFRSGNPDSGGAAGVFSILFVEVLFLIGYVWGGMFVARSLS